MAQSTCATCLRAVGLQGRVACSGCLQACFCSPACQQTAQQTPWLHSAPICSAYAGLAALDLSADDQSQLRFLLHALALRHVGSPEAECRLSALLGLAGEATEAELAVAARLAPALQRVLGGLGGGAAALSLDVAELATLLRKEQLNSYGVLASQQQVAAAAAAAPPTCGGSGGGGGGGADRPPPGEGVGGGGDGERRLRGSAIYAQASLINHECLPNVARFDFFDSGAGGPAGASTRVSFRALHDLPPGTELAQSYVPLHWGLAERQAQCREVYGFACTCPRCQTESQWSDEEEEGEWETDSGGGGGDTDADADADEDDDAAEAAAGPSNPREEEEVEMEDAQTVIRAPPGEGGPLEPTYLRLFLLKYMCAAPGCFGTAAPTKPGSSLLECNVCGRSRSEREFLRELERSQQQQQQQLHHHQQQQQQRSSSRGGVRR